MKKIPVRQLKAAHESVKDPAFKIRKVENLELIEKEQKIVQDIHKHDFYFILAIQNGSGTHEIDFVQHPVTRNTIFLMRPGQAHKLNLKKNCTGYLIEFSPGFYHPRDKKSYYRFRKATNKNYCKPENNRFAKLLGILDNIYIEFSEQQDGYIDIIKSGLEIFIIEYNRESVNSEILSNKTNPYLQDRFEDFTELLNNNITSLKLVSHYTELMNITSYQLNEITKSAVDKTASELITDQIILEAKRYLLATTNQIKDIADMLGYEDVSYFIRFFKKHTGYSPDNYRKNNHL